MKKLTLIIAILSLLVLFGCQNNQPTSLIVQERSLSKKSNFELEVKPVWRIKTDRPGEFLTVFVFSEKMGKPDGGRGGKPPKKTEECSDLNTNQAFAELGVVLPSLNFPVEYHPAFEPTNASFDAIDRAVSAWEGVSSDNLLDFAYNALGTAAPERDFTNVIGWRQFVGRGSGFLAVTFIWDDGTIILEADIFYNLKHKWAVNATIAPGETTCGTNFDIQAIGTHELGHLIGLGHVVNANEDDATMAPSAAKGELQKQTLTPGDISGVLSVISE